MEVPNNFKNIVDYAGWLADKIHSHGDYAKESAFLMLNMAKEIDRMNGLLEVQNVLNKIKKTKCKYS